MTPRRRAWSSARAGSWQSRANSRGLIDVLFVPIVGDRIRPLVGHGIPDALGHRVPLLEELLLGGGDLRKQAPQLITRRPIARDHRGGILQVVRDRLCYRVDLVDNR